MGKGFPIQIFRNQRHWADKKNGSTASACFDVSCAGNKNQFRALVEEIERLGGQLFFCRVHKTKIYKCLYRWWFQRQMFCKNYVVTPKLQEGNDRLWVCFVQLGPKKTPTFLVFFLIGNFFKMIWIIITITDTSSMHPWYPPGTPSRQFKTDVSLSTQRTKHKLTHPKFNSSPWKMGWKPEPSYLGPGNFSGAFAVKLPGG